MHQFFFFLDYLNFCDLFDLNVKCDEFFYLSVVILFG